MTSTLGQPTIRNASLIATKAQGLLETVPVISVGSIPVASSDIVKTPVEDSPENVKPMATTTEATTTETPVLQSLPTIKLTKDVSDMSQTKSGDTWLNIQLPNSNAPAPGDTGSTLTPEQKSQRMIIGASVLLVVVVLVVWAMNRKK